VPIAKAEKSMEAFKHIKVDVNCHWSETPPAYRIYVDSDLLTERTFSWPGYQNYIRENLICNLNPGIHSVRIENCSANGSFTLTNLEVEGDTNCLHPNHTDPEGKQLTFIVN